MPGIAQDLTNAHVYTDATPPVLLLSAGKGRAGSGDIGTAITNLKGTLATGQSIQPGTRYLVSTHGPLDNRTPPLRMMCIHATPDGYTFSTGN